MVTSKYFFKYTQSAYHMQSKLLEAEHDKDEPLIPEVTPWMEGYEWEDKTSTTGAAKSDPEHYPKKFINQSVVTFESDLMDAKGSIKAADTMITEAWEKLKE